MELKSIIILALLVLTFVVVKGTPDNNLTIIPSSEVLAKINNREPVEYAHVIIKGDLNLSQIVLPQKFVQRDSKSWYTNVVYSSIGISDSTIDGNLDFSNAKFVNSVNFNNSTFKGDARFEMSLFDKSANFKSAKFNGTSSFYRSEFTNCPAQFEDSTFNRNVDFAYSNFLHSAHFENSKIKGLANFENSEFKNEDAFFKKTQFNGTADFQRSLFNKNADFSDSSFNGDANFGRSSFKDNADFRGSSFNRDANFRNSSFEDDASFISSKFNGYGDFSGSQFNKSTEFNDAVFQKETTFSDSKFSGDTSFGGSLFKEDVLFEGTDFDCTLYLTRTKYDKLYIRWRDIKDLAYDDTAYLSLMENFKKLGYLEDYDNCYFEYRKEHRSQSWSDSHHGMSPKEEWIWKKIDFALEWFYGYGKRPLNPLGWSTITILFFSIIWWIGDIKEYKNKARQCTLGECRPNKVSASKNRFLGRNRWSKLHTLAEAMIFSATVFLSGTRLFIDPPDHPDMSRLTKFQTNVAFTTERILGALFSILFFLAISATVVR